MTSLQKKPKRSLSLKEKTRDRYISFFESLLDNILAFFFQRSEYLQNLKDYISYQVRTRTKYFLIGILLLVFAFYLLFFFLIFFYLFLYQTFFEFIKQKIIVYFLLLWITLIIFWVAIYNSLNFFYKIGKKVDYTGGKK